MFTILDDTDDSTVGNVKPIYDLLHKLGFRTTKTVWANDCPDHLKGNYFAGHTLRNDGYLEFAHSLVAHGFELAFHNATMGSSDREGTEEALRFLKENFGHIPRVHCNHGQNRENLYWGTSRYHTCLIKMIIQGIARITSAYQSEGHIKDSPFFWGDLCLQHFDYVRGLSFPYVDTSTIPPPGPYHDPKTPWVRQWFTTSDAPNFHSFRKLLDRRAVDRLVTSGGVCIVSTHLGKGFVRNGRVDAAVEEILRHIAIHPGWFVPVSTVLDFLRSHRPLTITPLERFRLEATHIATKVVEKVKRATIQRT